MACPPVGDWGTYSQGLYSLLLARLGTKQALLEASLSKQEPVGRSYWEDVSLRFTGSEIWGTWSFYAHISVQVSGVHK